MDEKEAKSLIDATVAAARREFEIVTEGIRSDFRLVVESVTMTNERVDRLAAEMADGFADVHTALKIVADHVGDLRAEMKEEFGHVNDRLRALETPPN